jgi:hypothetical protein
MPTLQNNAGRRFLIDVTNFQSQYYRKKYSAINECIFEIIVYVIPYCFIDLFNCCHVINPRLHRPYLWPSAQKMSIKFGN